jgi:hypothetical protein
MGNNCSCFQNDSTKSEVNLDPKRMREISIKIFILTNLANKIKTSHILLRSLHTLQARVRGIYIRNKLRSMNNNKRFMPNDSYNKFTPVNNSKIVIIPKNLNIKIDRGSNKKIIPKIYTFG